VPAGRGALPGGCIGQCPDRRCAMREKFGDWGVILDRFAALADPDG
jgi:hypothetical protein